MKPFDEGKGATASLGLREDFSLASAFFVKIVDLGE